MSRDKYQAKRLYKAFGAATPKRIRKQVNAKSGPPTMHKGRGFKFVVFCPECDPQISRERPVGVAGNTKRAKCRAGHIINIQH